MLLSCCYRGTITYKFVLAIIYAGIEAIIETIIALMLAMLSVSSHLFVLGSIKEYFIGLVLANLVFLLIVGCLYFLLRKKMPNVLGQTHLMEPYWDLLFFILIVITMAISCGIDYLTIKQGLEHGLLYFILLLF